MDMLMRGWFSVTFKIETHIVHVRTMEGLAELQLMVALLPRMRSNGFSKVWCWMINSLRLFSLKR
jgi:hypothetical protein